MDKKVNKIKSAMFADPFSTGSIPNSYPSGMITELKLFGEIGDSSEYISFINTLLSAAETDTIYIQIDSCGGSCDTAITIINAMKKCKGTIIAEIYGQCSSAATWIFLSADSMIVNEDIQFMIHNYSSVNYGKGGELTTSVTFTDLRIKKVMDKIYTGFLTEDELAEVYKGVDFYFTDEQLGERLNTFCAYKEAARAKESTVYYTLKKDFLEKCLAESNSRDDVIKLIEEKISSD